MARKKQAKQQLVGGILNKPVVYDELPSKRFEKTSKYVDALAPLTKKKGKWFLIATFESARQANGIASFLRREPATLPDGKWEFGVRTLDDGLGGLFARFLG